MRIKSLALASAAFVLMSTAVASASVVTSLPGGTSLTLPNNGTNPTFVSGPITFGPGVTWTSTTGSVFGYSGSYGFEGNGFWPQSSTPMVGLQEMQGTMTFTFANPIEGFLGEVNWGAGSTAYSSASMTAFNSLGQSLGTINFSTLGTDLVNPGLWGFLDTTNDIASIQLKNSGIAMRNISIQSAAVSVPGPIVGAGLPGAVLAFGGLLGWLRRRKAALAA